MKAEATPMLTFLKKAPQFVIPIYQRTYSWTDKQCRQLWDDVLRAGKGDDVSAHFIGSVVYVEKGLYSVVGHSPLLVIDGQQRLTTVSLIIAALAEALGETQPQEDLSARKLRNFYLLEPEESGERKYKLLLSQTDKSTLLSIVADLPMPHEPSQRVVGNYELFREWMRKSDPVTVWKGLTKLLVVDISLNRDHDNPQLIFESMNSTGKELGQADLIRNFILMGLDPDTQTRLYELYWRPIEQMFGQEAYATDFDWFMRHFLTIQSGAIPRIGEVYEEFKKFAQGQETESLLAGIKACAEHYAAVVLLRETDTDLLNAFKDLRDLRVDVAIPLLLELYGDYCNGILTKPDLVEAARLVESYIFRRSVCGIPTNSMNKTFATFARSLDKSRYLESLKAQFLFLPSYRRFPQDGEFNRDIQARDLYNFRTRGYWLRRLENHGRKERVQIDEYTIEHIMPQNEKLSAAWQAALGADWQRVQATYLHTLGNLTLTGYNSEYSDRPFEEKRDHEKGFRKSPLVVNEGLSQEETWNEVTIKNRAAKLAARIVTVWPAAALPESVLNSHRAKPSDGAEITLESFGPLNGPVRPIFDAFRREVMALDPCVVEELNKSFIGYRAERNFVDVVPQHGSLCLRLNIPYEMLEDSTHAAIPLGWRDVWGNGGAEFALRSLEEVPHAIGLARQALEQQLGGPDRD